MTGKRGINLTRKPEKGPLLSILIGSIAWVEQRVYGWSSPAPDVGSMGFEPPARAPFWKRGGAKMHNEIFTPALFLAITDRRV